MNPVIEKIPNGENDGEQGLFKKILLAVDLSKQTPHIIEVGSYLAKAFKAEVLVLSVVNIPTSVSANESDGLPANEKERESLDGLRLLGKNTTLR